MTDAVCSRCFESVEEGVKTCPSCNTSIQPPKCPACFADVEEGGEEAFCLKCGAASPKRSVFSARGHGGAGGGSFMDNESVHIFDEGDISFGGEDGEGEDDGLDPVEPIAPTENVETPPLTVAMQAEAAEAAVQVAARPISIKMPAAPKCAFCGKSVYETERCLDGQDRVFHTGCFRCRTCKCTLKGRQRVEEPESGNSVKVANGQYLVVTREGSRLGQVGEFLCDKHSVVAIEGQTVKGKDVHEKVRDEAELNRISMRKEVPLDSITTKPPPPPQKEEEVAGPTARVEAQALARPVSVPMPKPALLTVAPNPGNKCLVCGKTAYETEKALDSQGRVFHSTCFRCKTCKCVLKGRQRVEEPGNGASVKLANAQYLVVVLPESRFGALGDFLCDKHCAGPALGEVAMNEKMRDEDELVRISSLRKDQNLQSRDSLQRRAGDMLPVCFRCGLPIDKGQKAFTEGIRKAHAERCPTKEESALVVRSVRHFVKSFLDRLAATLLLTAQQGAPPHTFLYVMDESALNAALLKRPDETCLVRFVPDQSARLSMNRKIELVGGGSELDIKFRDFQDFTFVNPNTEGEKGGVSASNGESADAEGMITITKFFASNGVLQTLRARFKYDAEFKQVMADSIEIVLEMWPKEAAREMELELNPLAKLRQQQQQQQQQPETRVEEIAVTTTAEKETVAAALAQGDDDVPLPLKTLSGGRPSSKSKGSCAMM